MYSYTCTCGKKHIWSGVSRCPCCNKDLSRHSDDYVRKHVIRCSRSVNPHRYSDRKPSRPSQKHVEEHFSEFRKHCRNCGTPHCQGCDEGICDDWSLPIVERCPFCGRMPVQQEVDGVHTLICDECQMSMWDTELNKLVTRWNRV